MIKDGEGDPYKKKLEPSSLEMTIIFQYYHLVFLEIEKGKKKLSVFQIHSTVNVDLRSNLKQVS